jgi:hypothetical protein
MAKAFANNMELTENIYWNPDNEQYCAEMITTDDISINLGYYDTNIEAENAKRIFMLHLNTIQNK